MKQESNFFDDVYAVVRLIPPGRATSYGAIAAYLGLKSGARTVGWAMRSAHALPDVPAHRVLNRNGQLTGKHCFGGPQAMQHLLEAEGIAVANDAAQHWETVFWSPTEHLAL